MKLIFCKVCQDIVKLDFEKRYCKCGRSSGYYRNNVDAVYTGEDSIPIGIENNSLLLALRNQPDSGIGERFDAFIIPKRCDTFIKEKK